MGGIFDRPILSRLFILCQVKFGSQNKPNMKRCPILIKSLLELLQEGREISYVNYLPDRGCRW